MPRPEHEEHLCFLEGIGYLKSPKLFEMGVDRREENTQLLRGAKVLCKKAAGMQHTRKTYVSLENYKIKN